MELPLRIIKFNFLTSLLCFVEYFKGFNFESPTCSQLPFLNTHPLACCPYPQFIDNPPDTIYRCTKLCKSLPSPPFYCMRNCKITESGVISRGNFSSSKVVKLFFEGDRKLSQAWLKVVQKTAKSCEREVPTKNGIKHEDYNFFYTKFTECVRMENFLNCPSLSESEKCGKMREMMGKCDDSNYLMLHELFFEEFYNRTVKSVEVSSVATEVTSLTTEVETTTEETRTERTEKTTSGTKIKEKETTKATQLEAHEKSAKVLEKYDSFGYREA